MTEKAAFDGDGDGDPCCDSFIRHSFLFCFFQGFNHLHVTTYYEHQFFALSEVECKTSERCCLIKLFTTKIFVMVVRSSTKS